MREKPREQFCQFRVVKRFDLRAGGSSRTAPFY